MPNPVRKVTPEQLATLQRALIDLQAARNGLREAGAKKAAAYVQRALKSAEGAWNHAQRCYYKRHPEERSA